jgi:hypothetical protein
MTLSPRFNTAQLTCLQTTQSSTLHTGKNLQDMEAKLNMDLIVVTRWLKANKTYAKPKKTKFQIITHKHTKPIYKRTSGNLSAGKSNGDKISWCTHRHQIEFQRQLQLIRAKENGQKK